MKKIILKLAALGFALVCLLACAAGMLTACDKTPEEHDVLIEVINPQNGEVIAYPHHAKFSAPQASTPIEVRVKDRVTGEYVTDEDLQVSSLYDCTFIRIFCYSDWSDTTAQEAYSSKWWPSSESPYRIFRLTVTFNYPPLTEDVSEIDLWYGTTTIYIWCEYI